MIIQELSPPPATTDACKTCERQRGSPVIQLTQQNIVTPGYCAVNTDNRASLKLVTPG